MSLDDQIADAARTFACSLYRSQPGALIPNPISEALHHAWDAVCGDPPTAKPLPAPPAPPYKGGQCRCTLYRVYFSWLSNVYQPGTRQKNDGLTYGAVEGITIDQDTGSRSFTIYLIGRGKPPNPCGNPGTRSIAVSGGLFNGEVYSDLRIDSIVIEGGGVDTCGDPPKVFPPAAAPPAGGYTSPPVAITFNDGDTNNYYFNFTPPSPPSLPAGFIPPIVINYINASLSPSFKIPITFNFDGSINFGSPSGGGNFSDDDRNIIKNIQNNSNTTNNNVTKINNEFNNFVNNTNNKPPKPEDFDPPPPPTDPGTHEKSYLAAVEISLTELPKNAKTQYGAGAPNVIYAGWFEWMRKGKACPREPIHFQGSVFLAPPGVDGYSYTLYTGYKGKAQEIINKEKT